MISGGSHMSIVITPSTAKGLFGQLDSGVSVEDVKEHLMFIISKTRSMSNKACSNYAAQAMPVLLQKYYEIRNMR
jgi:hypothetical protein